MTRVNLLGNHYAFSYNNLWLTAYFFSVFHDLEYECKRSYKKRYYMSIMGWIPKSIKKLNRRLDDLSIVQVGMRFQAEPKSVAQTPFVDQ